MKRYLLLSLLISASFCGEAQTIYRSIEQAKYSHGKSLQYISKSRYDIEISFHLREGFILLKNNDLGYKHKFINVIPTKDPNTWRAFSKDSRQTYLFSIITTKEGKCITMDDNVFVYVMDVREAS